MVDFFLTKGLTENECDQVEKMLGEPVFYPKGSQIYSEDYFKPAIGVIFSGSLAVKTKREENITMRSLKTGETFGVSAVFCDDGETFVSRIYAEKDSEIVFLSEETLKEVFARFPVAAENYIRLLSKKIKFLNRMISLLSAKSVEQRVYEFLCSKSDEKGICFLNNMTQVSQNVGIGRSSLYRCLDSLQNDGLIERQGKEIKVIYYEKNI